MPSQVLRNEVIKEIRSMVEAAANAASLGHSGFIGHVREILAAQLLQPLLPSGVDIGNGKITDSEGTLSSETDLIIFSRSILPPLIYGHNLGVFPLEACIYAIEIKSKLTASELKDSIEKVRRLRTLRYLPSFYPLNFIRPVGPPSSIVIPALFAFDSDLDVGSEVARYRKYDEGADKVPLLPIICIPGRGYWRFSLAVSPPQWLFHSPTPDYDEVIDFIGGVTNTIPEEIWKKGHPYHGNYIMRANRSGETC